MIFLKTIRITKRPSVDIPFYQWSDSFISYVEDNYVNTNKLIGYIIALSDGGLTETRTSIWARISDFNTFINSDIADAVWIEREEYHKLNGIISSLEKVPIEANSIEEVMAGSVINLRN
jgi:hypothetical protein